jgi:hypothetical protein
VNHSYPCLDFSRGGKKREKRKGVVVRVKEQTCKKAKQKSERDKKKRGVDGKKTRRG